MAKKQRTTVTLGKEDLDFLEEIGFADNHSEGVRFLFRLARLHTIPALRAIKEKEEKR